MTPMTDDAVTKQNKLRELRHEMIQVFLKKILINMTAKGFKHVSVKELSHNSVTLQPMLC